MGTVPERLAALEERVENIRTQLNKVSDRVDEIYFLIQRGKGAKWMVIAVAAMVSWFLGVSAHKLLPNIWGNF